MARITSEGAVLAIGNRYELILIAARRARELKRGWRPRVNCKNGYIVTAIREVEEGKVGRDYLLKPSVIDRREQVPESERNN